MSEDKNEVLLSLVFDLSRRRKRIMKREMGLGERPEKAPGAPRGKKLFPPDILCQGGKHGCHRAKSGPPMAKLRILTTLREIDHLSQKNLAQILSIRPQSLSEVLAKMESDGLVTRTPGSADRREVLVRITDAGRAKIASYEDERREYAASFFAPLSDEEKDQLTALLGKLLANEEESV